MIAGAMTLPLVSSDEIRSSGRAPRQPMDEARFEAFYRKTAGSLWSYIYRLTGNATVADDLLQKTFFRFLRLNPPVEDDDHLRRYLFRTATNLAFDHFRESKRDRGLAEMQQEHEGRPDLRFGRGELRHDMMRIFRNLKPRERALLWLAHVEGSDHDEIGEALGIKSKSVRVLLFRARKRLGEMLTKSGLGPEVMR